MGIEYAVRRINKNDRAMHNHVLSREKQKPTGSPFVIGLKREEMVDLTIRNPYGRFRDGRPKVPESLLDELRKMTCEDLWDGLYAAGYHHQFDGDWITLCPEKKLIGRAVTAQFMPLRPDVDDRIQSRAARFGLQCAPNQQIIDSLEPYDVPVIDLFGKREGGSFVGDILATAIEVSTNTGLVVNGAVRDAGGIRTSKMPCYVRSVYPTPLHDVMLTGINIPIRIGMCTVMPGDIVLGDGEGVLFIPPETAHALVQRASKTARQHIWVKQKLLSKKYKTSELYPEPQTPEVKADCARFVKQAGSE